MLACYFPYELSVSTVTTVFLPQMEFRLYTSWDPMRDLKVAVHDFQVSNLILAEQKEM